MSEFLQVMISAETREQADLILNSLLGKKLVTGGQFIEAPARFLWKGQIQDMGYVNIVSFTLADLRDAVIADVEATSVESVPMISFVEMDGNQVFLDWIKDTLERH